MTRLQANALLLLAGGVWGMGFVAQAKAMESVGPYLFIAMRFLVACVVVLPFAVMESLRHQRLAQQHSAENADGQPTSKEFHLLTRDDLSKYSLIGAALFCGMACQQVGLLTTSVTNSGFLTGLYVVFTLSLIHI